MTIPTVQYKEHEVRAYVQQIFPLHRDPYATGARRYSAIIRIDTIPFDEATSRRYTMQFTGKSPAQDSDAVDLAMQYGRDIIDGAIQTNAL